MNYKNIDEFSKAKLIDEISKVKKNIEKVEQSIKNHSNELDEKKIKLESLKKDADILEKLKKFVNIN